MASPKSLQTDSALQDIPPHLDNLLRAVSGELETAELESVVKSIKNTLKGTFEMQHDQDLYSCLLLFANQGLLSGENLTLLEKFVAAKATKKGEIKQRIETFKRSRLQEDKPREELKGRGGDLEDIMTKLSGKKPMLNLYGSSGIGKTTLGKEICLKWPGKHVSVDLREVTEMKDVYFHVMLALDTQRTVIRYDENPVIEQLQKLLKEGTGDVLLLLDNVEQFSGGDDDVAKTMNTNFIGFLHRLLDFKVNEEKAQLRVLLISRKMFQIEDERKKKKKKEENAVSLDEAVHYKEVEALKAGISTEILQKAGGIPRMESTQIEKLVEICKRKPLLLNGMAAILRQKIADAETLLETIEQELAAAKPEEISVPLAEKDKKGVDEQDYRSEEIDEGQRSCLRKMFFLLPSDTLRYSAVAVSLFCRPFTVEAAAIVLDADISETIILLEGLRNSELLSVDPAAKELLYDIHPLMRSFLRSVGSSSVFKQVYAKAKRRFCDLFITKMREMATMLDKDYMNVSERFDLDKPNFELALDISFKTDYLNVPKEYEEGVMICHLFDAMIDQRQRRKIYKTWADIAVEDGKEGSLFRASMRCQEALQVLGLQGWKNATEILRLAEDSLKTVYDELKSSDHYKLTRGSYMFVEGEICYRAGNTPKALKSLFHSLEIMEELLKSHTSTTRCLNAIGNCYNKLGNATEALKFYTRALEMRKKLSGSNNHLDLPLFKGQIGTVYEGQKQYDEAIKCYQEALELSKQLKYSGMLGSALFPESGILSVALFHRNIANAYAWQKEFKKAYKSAMAGYEIRKDILGNHPHTARSAFQLGLICSSLEEFDEAEDFFAEAWSIEKSLGNANHSEVRDRIVQSYEEIVTGNSKKEFQREALEFYQRIWEEEREFSYANRAIIDEINARLSTSGDRKMVKKYRTEALRFYEMAWNSPDLQQLPQNQREDILQTILYLSKTLREKELHKKYQIEAFAFYEKQWEEQTAVTTQDKKDILYTLKDLAKKLGEEEKGEKYKKLYEELESGSLSLRPNYFTTSKTTVTTKTASYEEAKELLTYRPGNGSSGGDRMDNDSNKGYVERSGRGQCQVRGYKKKHDSEETSTNEGPTTEERYPLEKPEEPDPISSFLPEKARPASPKCLQSGTLEGEGIFPGNTEESSLLTKRNTASNIITRKGGVVSGKDVKLMFPPGAVDDPLRVTITLEDPSRYCGLIAQKDLENDVKFCAPIINLQPSGHVFKKPVTLTTKLKFGNFNFDNGLTLHGTETRNGQIIWQDIGHNSNINETNSEVNIETERFSVIWTLLRLTAIRTKDIVSRFNLLAFDFTMSVLFNDVSNPNELALLFVSKDVHCEQFYREHHTSELVRLKAEGFRELHVHSIGGQEERRIYNHEDLRVSVCLGEDYKLANIQHDFAVESYVWWNPGHVIKLPLERTKDVRILCGKISVEGKYGHTSQRQFCELDLHGYVRGILDVEGAIFNLMPIAQVLKMPEETLDQVKEKWNDEDQQLEVILQHWLRDKDVVQDLAALRKDLERLKLEDYGVSQRGQMHVRHLRHLATKVSGLQHDNAELTKYFSGKIQTLCEIVLRDCCIELEGSREGVERAASSTNLIGYLENLEMQRRISKEISRNYQRICSSSAECIIKTFLETLPCLIQTIKEIFSDEMFSEQQNGLRGLSEETLEQFVSNIRDAVRNNRIRELVCEVCKILEHLCLENCRQRPAADIEKWGNSLAILSMLDFLKPFFQDFVQDVRLHKRLELFSGHLRDIVSDLVDVTDEVFMRDFSNVSLSLIHFAKFDPSKLVRFDLLDLANSPVTGIRETVEYDKHQDTFSQRFHIKNESEDELQLHAVALIHVDGKIRKIGAFQSVIMLSASAVDVFDECVSRFNNVTMMKMEGEDSERLRVVLCSTQKEKLSEVLHVLTGKLSKELIDLKQSQITQCHFTMRSAARREGSVLSFRLIYKWGSEAVFLDSKESDFVAFVDSSAEGACVPEVQLVGLNASQLSEEAFSALSLTSTDGNVALGPLAQLRKNLQVNCEKIELHVHQNVNYMKGHVCVVGDKTTLNDQMSSQRALPEGPSSAGIRSITDGKRSEELNPPS